MKKHTLIMPMLPGLELPKRGRKPRSPQQVFAAKLASIKKKSIKQIGEIFESFIPRKFLAPEESGSMSRRRFYTKENTFWAFFGQVLDPDGGCKEAVHKLQAFASLRGIDLPSSSTASYCMARKKFPEEQLVEIYNHTAKCSGSEAVSGALNNRRVIVVDGTGISMPDTQANQEIWPQSASQKPGCGFPTARICAAFSIEQGTLLDFAIGNKKNHKLPLFRKLWKIFKPGDIFLGDKGFCSYFDMANLEEQSIDSVVTLARRKPFTKSNCLIELGKDDLLIKWKRPVYNVNLSYSKEKWAELPLEITLRQIKVIIKHPGFRSQEFHLVTTLLDHTVYPAEELAKLYFKRWDVELFFRDIKVTMGLDILRCKSPEMIRKEILIYFIAYNCIRRLMKQSAETADVPIRTVSFKGSVQAIRNWEPLFMQAQLSNSDRLQVITDLYIAMTKTPIRQRPGRSEPRCVKRRPKPYQLLTKQRHEMREIPHKSKYKKQA